MSRLLAGVAVFAAPVAVFDERDRPVGAIGVRIS
jgi:hypothetical protein